MQVLSYQIKLLEPLLATQLEGDPNSSVSYPYVPGSLVRGVLVTAYTRSKSRPELLVTDAHDRALFLDGQTRYLNAYPLLDGGRALPTPLSWKREKAADMKAGTLVYDWSCQRSKMEQPKPVGKPFCCFTPDGLLFVKPERRINVHTARPNREHGRARRGQNQGTVFQYNALAEGQSFAGLILLDDGLDPGELQKLLYPGAVYYLGRSQNVGYGKVVIESVALIEKASNWRETGQASGQTDGEKLVVTLLSDALLRDRKSGLYAANPTEVLAEALRMDKDEPGFKRAFAQNRPVGGFNRKWGLPLPQAQAIAAGSVWIYRPAQTPSMEAVQKLEQEGIGERRVEGFGRVGVNWHQQGKMIIAESPSPQNQNLDIPALEGVNLELAQTMLNRWQRRDLDRQLGRQVNELKIYRPPENAQLARFRVLIRDELGKPEPGLKRLQNYLKDVNSRQSTRSQFERARVGAQRLNRWLDERLKKPETVWETIGYLPAGSRQLGSNAVRAERLKKLQVEYTIRLVDALLARAARERREERGA